MSQVEVLISLLRKDWISTADAFGAGISSFHRRLADLRESHHRSTISDGKHTKVVYLVDGKQFSLKSQGRTIATRWGQARIKLWKLVKVQ